MTPIPAPPMPWYTTDFLALGVLAGGLLAQASSGPFQAILGWLIAGGLVLLGAAGRYLLEYWQGRHKGTIGELQDILSGKREELKGLREEVVRRTAERDRIADRLGRCSHKITQLEAENAILTQANNMLQSGSDPFLVHQLTNPVGYMITDSAGVISDAGPNIRAILHWRDDDLVGRNVRVLIPEEFHAAHAAFMGKILDPAVTLDPQNVLSVALLSREGVRVPVNIRLHRWEDRSRQMHFTVYVQERNLPPGTGDDGGSRSGDSNAFLSTGDPKANTPTIDVPTTGGPGPAQAEGEKGG